MKTTIWIGFGLLLLSFITQPDYSKPPCSSAATAELFDLQGVKFASGLQDWKNKPVDSLVMDVYYPNGASSAQRYPLIVFCHAGGFTSGNRFNVSAICDQYAEQGFIAVGFEYRTGYTKGNNTTCTADTAGMVDAHYRAAQDAKACLRFLVANADTYRIDTSRIFIGGSSAGASLALESSYFGDSVAQIYFPSQLQRLGSLETSGNALPNTYTIKGIINMWGAIFHANEVIDKNYRTFPTITFKGDEDGGIPDSVGHFHECPNYPLVYAGPAVHAVLQAQNVPSVFYMLPGASHSAYDDQFCVQQSVCFMKAIMAGTPYSGSFTYFATSCR